MTTVQINTSEIINQINKRNDSKQNLGDGDKMFHRQEKNGIELLCPSQFSDSLSFEFFNGVNQSNYVEEMTKYEEAQTSSNNLELSTGKNIEKFTSVPEINYEDMYKDKICTFFIGSVTVIGLFIVYKMIER